VTLSSRRVARHGYQDLTQAREVLERGPGHEINLGYADALKMAGGHGAARPP